MSELVYNIKTGPIRESEIPIVEKESAASQTLKLCTTLGVFAMICLLMVLYNLQGLETEQRRLNRESDVSYYDAEPDSTPYAIGSCVQISCDEYLAISRVEVLASELISEGTQTLKFSKCFSKPMKQGNVFFYELDLKLDHNIFEIIIITPDARSAKRNKNATVYIRNSEGKKVWRNYQRLNPTPLNVIKVRSHPR